MTRRTHILGAMGAFVLSFAILGLLGGCGSGGTATTEAPHSSHPHETKRGRLMFPGPPPKSVKQGCLSAMASVGKSPQIIDVTVRCISHQQTREEFFWIGRHILGHPLRRASVTAYTHKPRVIDHVVGGSGGACHREEKQSVACAVRVNGASRVKVRLWVPPETRCTAEVSVVMRRGTCLHKKHCFGAVLIYSLFRGKPRGC